MVCCSPLFFVFWRKNLLYLRYNIISLLLIFLGCGILLCGYLHWTIKVNSQQMEYYETKDYRALKEDYFPATDLDWLYYAPNTNNANGLMELVRQELQINEVNERFHIHNNSESMQWAMEKECLGTCFAIHIQQLPDIGSTGHFKYSISSNQMRISPKKRFVNDEEINYQKDVDEYIRVGFLTLQYVMDRQYMIYQKLNTNYDMQLGSIPNYEVSTTGSHRLVYFGTLYSILFSVLLLSTFVVPFVEEKQDGLKEFLNLVTPMSFLNGMTFFLIRLICYAMFLMFILLAAWHYKALGLISFGYMFILYLLYILATMSYAYLISVCFHSVFYAKIGGLVLLIIPYVFDFMRSWMTQVAYYLLSTNTFLEGLDVFQTFSNKHRQFGSADLFREIKDNSSRIFCVYILLILQCFLYAMLYFYLGCVFPGPGGLKRPFLFFLMRSTYQKKQRNEYTTSPRGTDAIIINDLYKKFRTRKRETLISDHLNMTIKNKEITVLLGHNGAGKTTTLNMIMGLVPKDSGKIVVCSERDVSSYRHLIGFCPQHSVFMSYMTCKQHLVFFAQLRGASKTEACHWADEKLRKLNLHNKTNEYGRNLSGGMKRRLSLGIALAGNTKIVILDEPSSGLDIESRRELWDILLNLRKEKAILITTHYMEEAEVLGDTICILANGKLQRSGSPLELKRQSGSGYRLKLLACEGSFKLDETLEIIRTYIPNASELNHVKPTVYISLPYAYKSQFPEMLRQLESKTTQLGIETISITDTSLEDVFLNCAGETDQVDSPDGSRNDAPLLISSAMLKDRHEDPTWLHLWKAIFYKKITFLINEWLYVCVMLNISIIAVIGAIILMHSMSVVTNDDALSLKLGEMRSGIVYLYNPTDQHAEVEQKLREQIESSGITARKLTLSDNTSIEDGLIALQRDNLADFLDKVIGVVDMNAEGSSSDTTPTFRLLFASNRYHSSVVLINLLDATMLKLQNANLDIDTVYVPIRRFVTDISPTRLEYYAVIVSVGMFFSMFFYVSLPFREYSSGFKHLQAMSNSTFWMATFSFDVLLHFCLCVVLWSIQQLIMPAELYKNDEILTIVISVFFYGCSYLPILYCLANNFKSISTISTYLLLMLIISAIAPLITSNNVQAMKLHETKIAFLCILPDFNLNHQLRIINENFLASRQSSNKLLLSTAPFFVYAALVCAMVMIFFIFISESKYRRQMFHNFFKGSSCRFTPTKSSPSTSVQLDPVADDCAKEKQHVDNLLKTNDIQSYPLLVSNLRKQFNGKPVVKDLNFAAARGECFGLLGVNGAGKTTTFQMIAANLTLSGGSIRINGIDIRENEVAYRYRFGYCPQYDALNKFMTAEQCLLYMARLRGLGCSKIEGQDLQYNVDYWLDKMNLLKYRNIQVRHFSGGTKRKLLAAMAMIGGPSIVLLDEPTTGVDPISRRCLWKCIKDFQNECRTVVLTSHSMDECEELCNRLAIMADGTFKCLNNICALKRFSGFTIKVKMKIDTETQVNVTIITRELTNKFPGLTLREDHAGMLTYFVRTNDQIIWSNVFKIIEDCLANRLKSLIDDYSVNECTLEDIFLKFDKEKKQSPPVAELMQNGNADNV